MVLPVPVQDTFAVGEILTAALMNKNVRDAVNFLENPPIFRGYQGTAQSVPNATFTDITFDSETVDSYGGHSTTTNNQRYTAQVAGWYLVTGAIEWAGNGTGRRLTTVAVNGSEVEEIEVATTATPVHLAVLVSDLVFLNVGDYVTLRGYQSSGAALSTFSSGSSTSYMDVLWVHA